LSPLADTPSAGDDDRCQHLLTCAISRTLLMSSIADRIAQKNTERAQPRRLARAR
jgi:hypothetical protein